MYPRNVLEVDLQAEYECNTSLTISFQIRPGIVTKDTQGRNGCKPIFSRIVSLHAENNHLRRADWCWDQD
ncbi:hypothetical protein BDR05DRAFT_632365 [Suillus weaverae]|nr:hypothetical protein BDR05DRAFT_632365 [Suillus weaverae]